MLVINFEIDFIILQKNIIQNLLVFHHYSQII